MDRVMPVCGEFFIQKIENFSPIDLMNILCMDVCSPIRKAASLRIAEMLTGIPPERKRAFIEALLSRYVSSKREAEKREYRRDNQKDRRCRGNRQNEHA